MEGVEEEAGDDEEAADSSPLICCGYPSGMICNCLVAFQNRRQLQEPLMSGKMWMLSAVVISPSVRETGRTLTDRMTSPLAARGCSSTGRRFSGYSPNAVRKSNPPTQISAPVSGSARTEAVSCAVTASRTRGALSTDVAARMVNVFGRSPRSSREYPSVSSEIGIGRAVHSDAGSGPVTVTEDDPSGLGVNSAAIGASRSSVAGQMSPYPAPSGRQL